MFDRYVNGHVERRVIDLRVGDRVDLESDPFADPEGYTHGPHNSANPEFAFEFLVVEHIARETDDCVRVDFNGFSCGFPPDHWIDVDGEQRRVA